jgi:hypothetical protein
MANMACNSVEVGFFSLVLHYSTIRTPARPVKEWGLMKACINEKDSIFFNNLYDFMYL